MVDSRLPSRWLHDPRIDQVSDHAWRMYTYSLMLANEQQSDGYIAPTQLRFLHPQGANTAWVAELLGLDLWRTDGDGFRVQRWAETQTTAAALAIQRERSRETSRAHRARKSGASNPTPVTTPVTGHALGEDRKGQDRKGQDRKGQDRKGQGEGEHLQLDAPVLGAGASMPSWPVALIPVVCRVCSLPIDPGTPRALCSNQDGRHEAVRLSA
jgi:hypothetical protein